MNDQQCTNDYTLTQNFTDVYNSIYFVSRLFLKICENHSPKDKAQARYSITGDLVCITAGKNGLTQTRKDREYYGRGHRDAW